MGIYLKKQKRYQEAMDYFEKCLENQADNFHAIYNAATLLYETGQYDLAKTWFQGAMDSTIKGEERKLAVIGLGATYEKMKDNKSAAKLYKDEGYNTKLIELEKRL